MCARLIHASGTIAGKFNRKNTAKSIWDGAKVVAAAWEVAQSWGGAVQVKPLPVPKDGQQDRIAIATATTAFLANREGGKIAPATLRKYRTFVRQLTGFAETQGYVMLDQFSAADIDIFYGGLKLGARAKGKRLGTLRAFFRFCVARKWLPENPVSADLKPPLGANRVANKVPFTDDELERIVKACDALGEVAWQSGDVFAYIPDWLCARLESRARASGTCHFWSANRLVKKRFQRPNPYSPSNLANMLIQRLLRFYFVGFLHMLNVGCLHMYVTRRKSLKEKIETRIAKKRGDDVFLTREFRDLGGEDQVLRVLRGLVRDNQLIRLGYGVYGRAVVSRLSGEPILFSKGGFLGAARQALTKLGVSWEPSEAERAYNEGRSTQIPVNPVVHVKGRFSRRLRDGKQELIVAR